MPGKIQKRHVQLTLDSARKPSGVGGWRPNAGRKKKPGAVSHDTRPRMPARVPQHVTLRIVDEVPSLARAWLMKIIRRAIRDAQKPTFAVVEFNVLANHLHLITEAAGKELLARGIAGLEVRLAKRLNRALKRRGKLFKDRYHARYLETPTQVRHAIRYVLFNRKHHDTTTRFDKYWIDPFSSAPWFTRWASAVPRWKRDIVDEPAPTVAPTTWLLSAGWLRLGALRFDEAPSG